LNAFKRELHATWFPVTAIMVEAAIWTADALGYTTKINRGGRPIIHFSGSAKAPIQPAPSGPSFLNQETGTRTCWWLFFEESL